MEGNSLFTPRFIKAIKSTGDEEYIYHVLRKLPEFQDKTDGRLSDEVKRMSYEYYERDLVLFRYSDLATCWYYVLTGSVMIGGRFFPPGERVGHEDAECMRRSGECLVLEATELLKIPFDGIEEDLPPVIIPSDGESLDGQIDGQPSPDSLRRRSTDSIPDSVNSEDILCDREPETRPVPRPFSDPSIPDSIKKEDEEEQRAHSNIYLTQLSARTLSSESLNKAYQNSVMDRGPSPLGNSWLKARASSLYDDDTTLSESHVDSDDDESELSEDATISALDYFIDMLSKDPHTRTEEDIDKNQEFASILPALSTFTPNMKRGLLQCLQLQEPVEQEDTVIIGDCESVDKWYIVLNGEMSWKRASTVQRVYHVGDCFGITQNLRTYHQSGLIVASKECQYAYALLEDFSRILTEGEENMKKIYNEVTGDLEMTMEKRQTEARSLKREGYFVVEATPDRLLDHLMEETVDDNYHIDFLLTYRTFLKSSEPIIEKLLKAWNERVALRSRVTHILLHWIGTHFGDFDTGEEAMTRFLDQFEEYHKEENILEASRLIEKFRRELGRTRIIEIEREPNTGGKSSLGFEIDGYGLRGEMIFVTSVEEDSQALERSLRVGDQLLSVNEKETRYNDLENMKKALKNTYKLKIKVRSNIPEYRRFLITPKAELRPRAQTSPKLPPVATSIPTERLEKRKSIGGTPSVPASTTKMQPNLTDTMKRQFGKLKTKLGTLPRPKKRAKRAGSQPLASEIFGNQGNTDGGKSEKKLNRSSSASNVNFVTSSNGSAPIYLVIKVYCADHSYKLFGITEKTTVKELIEQAVPEFYPESDNPKEYVISMVTVQGKDAPIKNSVVGFNTSDLFNFAGLDSRLYLRPMSYLESLIQGDVAAQMIKESKLHRDILTLDSAELAHEMTKKQSEVYAAIDPTEFISVLFKLQAILPTDSLERFQTMTSLEPFWVQTTVVSEPNMERRIKIIKKMIKIARFCKETGNYNSAFAIMSGLNGSVVQDLRLTWERVPTRHKKLKEDIEHFFDPSRNMAKYRSMLKASTSPLIPLFPLIMKDLTFYHEGLKSKENGLINFEKLRLLAKEIRLAKNYCNKVLEPPSPSYTSMTISKGSRAMSIGRAKGLRITQSLNLNKLYEQLLMRKRVQAYLNEPYVVQDVKNLELIRDIRLRCDEDTNVKKSKLTATSGQSPSSKRTSHHFASTSSGSVPTVRRASANNLLGSPPTSDSPPPPQSPPHLELQPSANGSAIQNSVNKIQRTSSVPIEADKPKRPKIKQPLLSTTTPPTTPPVNRKKD